MRKIANNFAALSDADDAFRELYSALESLEQDMDEHVHLENNILFPRAIELLNS